MYRRSPEPTRVPKSPVQNRAALWVALLIGFVVLYILSSGPVLATAFWLREKTGWNGFYNVMWFYLPILYHGHWQPLEMYIGWWVELFHTVGPG